MLLLPYMEFGLIYDLVNFNSLMTDTTGTRRIATSISSRFRWLCSSARRPAT